MGGVLHNNMGNMVVSYAGNYGGGSKNEAGALVLLWGLRIARAWGINKCAIERESMLIIKVAKGEG